MAGHHTSIRIRELPKPSAISSVWTPEIARSVSRLRFPTNCYWCGEQIPAGMAAVWYPREKLNSHERCHIEACCS